MNNDIRNLSKWLNEEQETPIDRQALARVLAMAEQPAQQEPVAYIRKDQLQKAAQSPMLCEVTPEPRQDRIGIHTSPPASKPWADECRIELVNAIHFLASDFENALGAFHGDTEARRKAEGDIAHARSITSRWNWNGTTAQPSKPDFKEFIKWAGAQGYDCAQTCNSDTGEWIVLNPMTADLWKAWQAAHAKGDA